uniref:Uncharacterized protein n=1 Tax=uncultured marine virus TaxID=186617 RepID=A0A0F7L8Y5_9VIRU|nr:hypothetical protein [uncultured marine virus]
MWSCFSRFGLLLLLFVGLLILHGSLLFKRDILLFCGFAKCNAFHIYSCGSTDGILPAIA